MKIKLAFIYLKYHFPYAENLMLFERKPETFTSFDKVTHLWIYLETI